MTDPAISTSPVRVERSRDTLSSVGQRPSTSLGTNGGGGEQDKLRKVAEQFEAVMLRQMLGSMRAASLGDGVFDSSATAQFRDMSDAKTAETLAGKGVLGIADLLVKQYGATLAPAAQAGAQAGAQPATGRP